MFAFSAIFSTNTCLQIFNFPAFFSQTSVMLMFDFSRHFTAKYVPSAYLLFPPFFHKLTCPAHVWFPAIFSTSTCRADVWLIPPFFHEWEGRGLLRGLGNYFGLSDIRPSSDQTSSESSVFPQTENKSNQFKYFLHNALSWVLHPG